MLNLDASMRCARFVANLTETGLRIHRALYRKFARVRHPDAQLGVAQDDLFKENQTHRVKRSRQFFASHWV